MKARAGLLTVYSLVLGCPLPSATTYVVTPDGTGDFATIQAAIDAAVHGDVIELADGTFRGDGNRDIEYGGKAITVRSHSGNPQTCVLDCEGDQTHYHRGFSFHNAEGDASVLQGLTVRNAYSDYGGGVRCEGASPRILGCVFENNSGYDRGGGLDCEPGSAPQVDACIFSCNWSMYGGAGARCYGSTATFTQCVFSENVSMWDGGGLACYYDGNPTLIDCVFTGNRTDVANAGGGGLYCFRSSPMLLDCSFVENTTERYGGGVMVRSLSYPTLRGCLFERNSSAACGGAICVAETSWPVVERCTLVGNSASVTGGGMCLAESEATVRGCTLVGNSAGNASGILCYAGSHLDLTGSIVASGVWGEGIQCEDTATATLSCCDLYGNEGGDWVGPIGDQFGTNGNISADPLFCDPGNEDFTLHANSPCAPDSNPDCGLIGAWPVGCSETPAETTTWGAIKAMFRR